MKWFSEYLEEAKTTRSRLLTLFKYSEDLNSPIANIVENILIDDDIRYKVINDEELFKKIIKNFSDNIEINRKKIVNNSVETVFNIYEFILKKKDFLDKYIDVDKLANIFKSLYYTVDIPPNNTVSSKNYEAQFLIIPYESGQDGISGVEFYNSIKKNIDFRMYLMGKVPRGQGSVTKARAGLEDTNELKYKLYIYKFSKNDKWNDSIDNINSGLNRHISILGGKGQAPQLPSKIKGAIKINKKEEPDKKIVQQDKTTVSASQQSSQQYKSFKKPSTEVSSDKNEVVRDYVPNGELGYSDKDFNGMSVEYLRDLRSHYYKKSQTADNENDKKWFVNNHGKTDRIIKDKEKNPPKNKKISKPKSANKKKQTIDEILLTNSIQTIYDHPDDDDGKFGSLSAHKIDIEQLNNSLKELVDTSSKIIVIKYFDISNDVYKYSTYLPGENFKFSRQIIDKNLKLSPPLEFDGYEDEVENRLIKIVKTAEYIIVVPSELFKSSESLSDKKSKEPSVKDDTSPELSKSQEVSDIDNDELQDFDEIPADDVGVYNGEDYVDGDDNDDIFNLRQYVKIMHNRPAEEVIKDTKFYNDYNFKKKIPKEYLDTYNDLMSKIKGEIPRRLAAVEKDIFDKKLNYSEMSKSEIDLNYARVFDYKRAAIALNKVDLIKRAELEIRKINDKDNPNIGDEDEPESVEVNDILKYIKNKTKESPSSSDKNHTDNDDVNDNAEKILNSKTPLFLDKKIKKGDLIVKTIASRIPDLSLVKIANQFHILKRSGSNIVIYDIAYVDNKNDMIYCKGKGTSISDSSHKNEISRIKTIFLDSDKIVPLLASKVQL